MLLSKYTLCDSKKSDFIKEQKASWILSNSRIKTPLREIPLVAPLLFWQYTMNKTVDKFLLAGDKFMPKIHLRQPGFTYSDSACELLKKTKKESKN